MNYNEKLNKKKIFLLNCDSPIANHSFRENFILYFAMKMANMRSSTIPCLIYFNTLSSTPKWKRKMRKEMNYPYGIIK